MKYDKSHLRKEYLLKRKIKYKIAKDFNFKFNLIFNLIKKKFSKKKIIIAGYYPSNYEVDILKFLKEAEEKKYKISLPAVKNSGIMTFKSWNFTNPLYVSKFGILEPSNSSKDLVPDLVVVPLVAFDKHLNRIGYGKGYYDRMLLNVSKIKKNTIFLGIAYSFQKCFSIPTNKYDFKLDYIFTERGIISSKDKS